MLDKFESGEVAYKFCEIYTVTMQKIYAAYRRVTPWVNSARRKFLKNFKNFLKSKFKQSVAKARRVALNLESKGEIVQP